MSDDCIGGPEDPIVILLEGFVNELVVVVELETAFGKKLFNVGWEVDIWEIGWTILVIELGLL